MKLRRLVRALRGYFTLGSVGDVVTQQRPPVLSDFGGGGLRSPIYINGLNGDMFIYVNGSITQINNLGFILVTAYGAVGDGTTDNLAPFTRAAQAAQSSGRPLYIPPGSYNFSGSWVVAATGLTIIGASSAQVDLRFPAGSNGVVLNYAAVNFPPSITGVSILTFQNGAAPAGVVGLTVELFPLAPTAYRNGLLIQDVVVRGHTTTLHGWSTNIHLIGCWYASLARVTIKGYSVVGAAQNSYETLIGLHLTDCMVPIFDASVTMQHINTFVYEDGSILPCEGFSFANFQFVGGRTGFDIGNGVGSIVPGGYIGNGHVDSSFRGIVFNNRAQAVIEGVLLYRTIATTDAYLGILVTQRGTNVISNVTVCNASTNITSCSAIWLANSSGNVISNIVTDGWTAPGAVVVRAGTSSGNIIDASTFESGPNGVALARSAESALTGTGNRIEDNAAVPTIVTAAAYTVLETDVAIIANRAGTVTLTLPSAAAYPGRELPVKTITANTVVSAASNVIPRAGGAAAAAIVAATAGNWATLKATGANWELMAGTP